ncbi:MAG: lamin tail domain-containing protein, partial [Prevotellaceae bacterium]|nr:lamin tail domain-containing protein [Prevotellaceae bacterium]
LLKVTETEIIDKNNIKIGFSTNVSFPDALNLDNYSLCSVSDTFDIFDVNKISDNELKLSTQLLSDTLFLLSISGITDTYGSIMTDTVIKLRRNASAANCSLNALERNLLALEFNRNMIDSIVMDTNNYLLTNVAGDIFWIKSVTKNSGKFYLDCDSLRGSAFVLYYNNLETEDGFILNDSIILEKSYLPAKINTAEAISSSTVIVEFSKNIREAGEYIIKNSHGTIFGIASKTVSDKQITLTLSETLSGNSFMLYVSETKDNEGFMIIDSTYFRRQTVNFGDLIFNEIMAKPNPPVSLPDREYLELYNRTSDSIDITNFRILYGTDKSSRITTGKIAPHEYAVICASSSVSELSTYGNAFSATSFPSLLDAGMRLTLTSPDSTIIAVVEYSNSFYGDETKSKGGWSLEKIDPDNLSDNGNWKASTDATGGTPCRKNSVADINPDNIQPYILSAKMIDEYSVSVLFSENIVSSILEKTEYYNVRNVGTPSEAKALNTEFSNTVELIFERSFNIGTVYELNVSPDVKDFYGNEYNGEPIFFGQMHKPEKENFVINEILFHPRSGGSDFVEIYNRSDRILDLSDISIASRNRTTGNLQQIHRVSEISIYVQPADYFVFTTDSASLHRFYYVDNPANVVIMSGFPTYPNEDGTVVLLDNEDNIIDEFSYSEDMHGIFISNPEGVSLERVDFDRQSSELGNWQSAAQTVGFATPTYKNSCYTHTEEANEPFVVSSTTFSPDGDGYEEVLFIDYKMPAAGFIANVTIYNIRGHFVKEICRNTTLGVDGRLIWDGTKSNNTKAPIGPYIIYIETFNANGKVYKYKKICVVASRK